MQNRLNGEQQKDHLDDHWGPHYDTHWHQAQGGCNVIGRGPGHPHRRWPTPLTCELQQMGGASLCEESPGSRCRREASASSGEEGRPTLA